LRAGGRNDNQNTAYPGSYQTRKKREILEKSATSRDQHLRVCLPMNRERETGKGVPEGAEKTYKKAPKKKDENNPWGILLKARL